MIGSIYIDGLSIGSGFTTVRETDKKYLYLPFFFLNKREKISGTFYHGSYPCFRVRARFY